MASEQQITMFSNSLLNFYRCQNSHSHVTAAAYLKTLKAAEQGVELLRTLGRLRTDHSSFRRYQRFNSWHW